MSGICLPIDASAGSPSFPAAQHRVAQAALLTQKGGRPLGARSGLRPGSQPAVTVTATQFTVTPFVATIDPMTALTVGAYLVAFLANETGGINAADSSNPRVDRLDVQVPDDPPGASPRVATIVYTPGLAAASPSAPAAPPRSIPLGTISVPKATTGSPSFTTSFSFTVACGGILPTSGTADRPSSPYPGQYIDDATLGLLRWNGSAWNKVGGDDTGLVNVTYGPGVTQSTYPLQYQVRNGVCYVSGDAKLTSGSMAASTQFNITGAGAFPSPIGGQTATEKLINCGSATPARAIITAGGQLIVVTGTTAVPNINLAGVGPYVVA
jgi:hypothetical protein